MSKKSIMPDDIRGRCFLCGRQGWTERHHVFGGPFRHKSEEYGITVYLCHTCHNECPHGVHQNKAMRLYLKRQAQQVTMDHYGWTEDEFRERFGKSYL